MGRIIVGRSSPACARLGAQQFSVLQPSHFLTQDPLEQASARRHHAGELQNMIASPIPRSPTPNIACVPHIASPKLREVQVPFTALAPPARHIRSPGNSLQLVYPAFSTVFRLPRTRLHFLTLVDPSSLSSPSAP
jgi:hypothetical protein